MTLSQTWPSWPSIVRCGRSDWMCCALVFVFIDKEFPCVYYFLIRAQYLLIYVFLDLWDDLLCWPQPVSCYVYPTVCEKPLWCPVVSLHIDQ